jgi:hypothetical protein
VVCWRDQEFGRGNGGLVLCRKDVIGGESVIVS